MAYIGLLTEEEAKAENLPVREVYDRLREGAGTVFEYFQVQGRMPEAIEPQAVLYDAIVCDRALPRTLKEQIGLVVSGINTSSYCVALHMEILHRLGIEKPVGRKLATNYEAAPVGEKEKVLFRFADKLTRRPGDVTEADVRVLHQAGWSEAAVLETVLTTALFGLFNRVSLGLGLMAEP